MTHYIAILVPSETGKWRVLIPDVPECEVHGSSIDTAKLAAISELAQRIRARSSPPPLPRDLSAIATDKEWMSRADIDFAKAVVTVIPVAA